MFSTLIVRPTVCPQWVHLMTILLFLKIANYAEQRTFHQSSEFQTSRILYDTAFAWGLVSLQSYVFLPRMPDSLVKLAYISTLWARLRLQGGLAIGPGRKR